MRPAALLLAAALALGACQPPQEAAGPPNVLMIVVDDLGARLASYGDPIARTPNIDRLADLGVRFDRAYVQFPLCNPSRTSMLSGRYPETTRILSNSPDPRLALGDVDFLPEHFLGHGYRTAAVGKIAHKPGSIRYSPPTGRDAIAALNPRFSFAAAPVPIRGRPLDVDDPQTIDGRYARTAARLLEVDRDQPFFLAVGFLKPHLPFDAPRKYFENYPFWSIRLPVEDPDHLRDVPEIATWYFPPDLTMPPARRQRAVAAYYACVEFVDAQIGLLLDVLDRKQLWDDTIVVLVSDHGFHLGEHLGLWRKGTLFEQSLRVPLVIAAPGMPRGAVVASPVELVDLYPTLVELAGLPPADGLQGRSLAPLMREPGAARGGSAYSIIRFGGKQIGRSIRTHRYRYSAWDGVEGAVLYDYRRDPHEHKNLAGDPRRAGTVRRMQKLLEEKVRRANGGLDPEPEPRG